MDESALSDLPRKIKLDLDTPFENFLWGIMATAFGGVLVCLWIGYIGGEDSPPEPALLKYIPHFLAVGICFRLLRWGTDNYYLLDLRQKTLFFHFYFLGFRRLTPFLRPDDIKFVAVQGIRKQTEDDKWYEYQLCLINRQGRVVPVSDPVRDGLKDMNGKAATLARVFDCPFLEGKSEHVLQSQVEAAGLVTASLLHKPLSEPVVLFPDGFWESAVRVIGVLILLLVVLWMIWVFWLL